MGTRTWTYVTTTIAAVSVLESIGVGSIATIGASLLVPSFGVMVIPGIIVFGSAHYLIKLASQKSSGSAALRTVKANLKLAKESHGKSIARRTKAKTARKPARR